MKLLKGSDYVKDRKAGLAGRVKALARKPKLVIIRVGERPDDLSYERSAKKRMEGLGILCETEVFPETAAFPEFAEAFRKRNDDPETDGILLLRPLPARLNEKAVIAMLDPGKDVDGITPANLAKVFMNDQSGFAPCTAEAALALLKSAVPDLAGKRAVVAGRSLVVGKPLAMLLLAENCTVTVCHSRTENLAQICREADVVAAAAGKRELIDGSFVSDGACILDIGIHVREDGSLCGDVNAESLAGREVLLTPVPGGVGSVTTFILAEHVVRAAEQKLT